MKWRTFAVDNLQRKKRGEGRTECYKNKVLNVRIEIMNTGIGRGNSRKGGGRNGMGLP